MLGLGIHRREEREGRQQASELLRLVGIGDRAGDLARNLPYGYQRRLEIARALATNPRLLCLDEPAAGFNPREKAELMELIRAIRERGYTILVIEHDMGLVMGVTDRIVVLDFGRMIVGDPGRGARGPGRDPGLPRHPRRETPEPHWTRWTRGTGRRPPSRRNRPTTGARTSRRASADGPAGGRRPAGRLREDRGHPGHLLHGGGGGDRHADRRQRRREDHDDEDDLGGAGRGVRPRPLPGEDITRLRVAPAGRAPASARRRRGGASSRG